MGADTKNTPNAPEFICPISLSKLKSSEFQLKLLHWASVVRGRPYSFVWNGVSCKKISNTDFRILESSRLFIKNSQPCFFWLSFFLLFRLHYFIQFEQVIYTNIPKRQTAQICNNIFGKSSAVGSSEIPRVPLIFRGHNMPSRPGSPRM